MILHDIKINGVNDDDMYKIREDRDVVVRAIAVFKDKQRLENVKKFIKKEKEKKQSEDVAIDLIDNDNIKEALGL